MMINPQYRFQHDESIEDIKIRSKKRSKPHGKLISSSFRKDFIADTLEKLGYTRIPIKFNTNTIDTNNTTLSTNN